MKICKKCNVLKELTHFKIDLKLKSGLSNRCTSCDEECKEDERIKRNKRSNKHYNLNKKKKLEYQKKWNEENKDKVNTYQKEYRLDNKKMYSEYAKQYVLNNRVKIQEQKKIYRLNNKEEIIKKRKEYYLNNKDKRYQYEINNKENIKQAKRKYQIQRRKKDPLFKLIGNTRNLIANSIKKIGYLKTSKTYDILGCTFEEFKSHLQNKFTDGMSLENHGEWHLDHIIPISTAKTKEEVIKLNHYTNFQPLWAEDNIKKGNKIIVSL